VVRAGGGEGGVPLGDEGAEGGIRECKVQNRGPRNGVKWEPTVYPGGVEKVVRDVESGIKVASRNGKLPFGQGATGIC